MWFLKKLMLSTSLSFTFRIFHLKRFFFKTPLSLGAVHDGSPPPSYLGGPGARKCRWEDGFIMSDLRHTSKGFRWSLCTVKQFHHFLK